MTKNDIRNVAIIAHVDHRMNTLVDQMLRQCEQFHEAQLKGERILDAEHEALLDAVATVPWTELCSTKSGPGKSIAAHVYGIALHDVYHAGQIQTVKALYKSR